MQLRCLRTSFGNISKTNHELCYKQYKHCDVSLIEPIRHELGSSTPSLATKKFNSLVCIIYYKATKFGDKRGVFALETL